jgi:nitrite reductase (NADH) small subunit
MPVLTFAAEGGGNCVTVRNSAFVFARTERGEFILPARCPHRGGPLHLAVFDDGGSRLICPWHERATSVSRHIKAGIPAVRRGAVVTAVFPGLPDPAYRVEHLPMSADLSRSR